MQGRGEEWEGPLPRWYRLHSLIHSFTPPAGLSRSRWRRRPAPLTQLPKTREFIADDGIQARRPSGEGGFAGMLRSCCWTRLRARRAETEAKSPAAPHSRLQQRCGCPPRTDAPTAEAPLPPHPPGCLIAAAGAGLAGASCRSTPQLNLSAAAGTDVTSHGPAQRHVRKSPQREVNSKEKWRDGPNSFPVFFISPRGGSIP